MYSYFTFGTLWSSTFSGTVLPTFNSTPGNLIEARGSFLTYSRTVVSCSGAKTTVSANAALMPDKRTRPAIEVIIAFILHLRSLLPLPNAVSRTAASPIGDCSRRSIKAMAFELRCFIAETARDQCLSARD